MPYPHEHGSSDGKLLFHEQSQTQIFFKFKRVLLSSNDIDLFWIDWFCKIDVCSK